MHARDPNNQETESRGPWVPGYLERHLISNKQDENHQPLSTCAKYSAMKCSTTLQERKELLINPTTRVSLKLTRHSKRSQTKTKYCTVCLRFSFYIETGSVCLEGQGLREYTECGLASGSNKCRCQYIKFKHVQFIVFSSSSGKLLTVAHSDGVKHSVEFPTVAVRVLVAQHNMFVLLQFQRSEIELNLTG